LKGISTGERAPSLSTRQEGEEAARVWAEDAIARSAEPENLRVVAVTNRKR
jgi:hypothetical protein